MLARSSSRSKVALVFALLMLVFPAFITSTVESAQSRAARKPTPTPKKKATPTPKRSKTSPTPKKTPAKTTAKSNTKQSSKTSTKDRKSTSKTTTSKTGDKNRNSKTAPKSTKSDKTMRTKSDSKTAKSKTSTNSKTAKTPAKPTAKTSAKTDKKNTTTTRKEPTVRKETTAKRDKPAEVGPDAPQIIVTSFSVPVRSDARASAQTVSRVKLGTVLKVSQKNPAWFKVQYASGGKTVTGWVSANSVNDLNAAGRQQLYRQIVERNYRPEMDFNTAAELYEFLSSVSGELDSSDASGDLELTKLRTLRQALKDITIERQSQAPYKEFLKSHEREIVYSEPAGAYYVTSNQFWELHTKYRKSTVSDTIAWEGALNPLPGECEGYINCYLFDLRMRFGEYLNHHPSGAHAAEALTNIANYLDPIVADSSRKEVYSGPTDVTDRAEFNNLIAELRTIVARLGFVEKERTLEQLRQIAEAYR